MRIIDANTIALMIDFQERIFPAIAGNEHLAVRVPKLIEGLKIQGIPILVTEQYVKGLGPTVPAIAGALGGIRRIEKSSFSCCDDPGFMNELTEAGRKFVVVAGVETHVCVLQTVIDLIRNDFLPVVAEDCVSSRNPNDKQIAIMRMRQEGAIITTYESILFELLRYSGTDRFKAISRIVK